MAEVLREPIAGYSAKFMNALATLRTEHPERYKEELAARWNALEPTQRREISELARFQTPPDTAPSPELKQAITRDRLAQLMLRESLLLESWWDLSPDSSSIDH